MSQAVSVSADHFVGEVLEFPGVVLVDFWGPGCGPCRMLAPILDQLAAENDPKKVKIVKVDVYESSEVANHYGITSLPTLLFFKNGEVVEQLLGMQSKARIQSTIDENIA
ncbi:MAG: thioredoxin [Planctomycetia bacterium]|nr:thioredoxin [Planctomycetia bacterium]